MDDLTQPQRSGDPTAEQPMTRREWELAEQVAELESRLRDVSHTETMREIELQSVRHELDLQMAYSEHLEKMLSDRQQQIEWFRQHAGPLASVAGLDDDDVRTQLLAERQRRSYRFIQSVIRFRRVFNLAKRVTRGVADR